MLDACPSESSRDNKRSKPNTTVTPHKDGSEILPPDHESSDADTKWFCFPHTTSSRMVVKLSEALIQVSMFSENFGAHGELVRIREAEFFLRARREEAPHLYSLLLNWTRWHQGHSCKCALQLAQQARVGCARSAVVNSDLEAARELFSQSKSHSLPKGSATLSPKSYDQKSHSGSYERPQIHRLCIF